MPIDNEIANIFNVIASSKKIPEGVKIFSGDDLSMGSIAPYGIPTGIPQLDLYLGQKGGYPASKIIEFYGFQMCGKTTAALQAAAEWQKRGGVVFFIDTEISYTPKRAMELGVNPALVQKSEIDTIENVFALIEEILENLQKKEFDKPVLIIVDSVNGTPTMHEVESSFDKESRVGGEAKAIKRGVKRINGWLADLACKPTIIFINHAYKKTGGYGKESDSGGGFAIKFYSSVRVEFTAIGTLRSSDKETRVGQKIKVSIEKLKGAPLTVSSFDAQLTNDRGFDQFESLMEAMLATSYGDRPKSSQVMTLYDGTQIKAARFADWVNENGGYDKQYLAWRKWCVANGMLAPWGGKE